jgi:hypothetical protein
VLEVHRGQEYYLPGVRDRGSGEEGFKLMSGKRRATYTMTDDRRKVLAEFEGDCTDCTKVNTDYCLYACLDDQSYTTDADMLRVFRKMTPGDFHRFFLYFIKQSNQGLQANSVKDHIDIAYWLMIENPVRALCLAADWIERGKG